jgi:thiol-disulfide isomerase/thioredoxin
MTETTPNKRYRWTRWLGEALFFLSLFLGLQFWQTRDVPSGPAPHFQGELASGSEISLDAWRTQHPGQAVLLYFWADWCPICKTVAGSVDAIGRDTPVLTVALQSGSAEHVARFLAEHQRRWLTMIDESGQITARYGFKGVPAFVVLDAAGNIRFVETGYSSEIGLRLRLWWAERFRGDV